MNTSIIDVAKEASKDDSFGIEPFQNGLIRFIDHANTPITVALQGEWGSGKTSLMNSLQHKLCEGNEFHGIWLNTWEYALMKDTESTLIGILSALVEETIALMDADQTKAKELRKKFWGVIKNVGTNTVKNAINQAVDGAGDEVMNAFTESSKASIGALRNDLEAAIASCIARHKKKGFIFFIDDLDRIDPPVAVQLLELLKNIFTLKNCVFVLAIDYDVVIKGLEPKFGKLTAQNEREFRSFFDKIIQLPFSMPVASYNIDKFLKESLVSIAYLSEQYASDDVFMNQLSNIANLSVGTNPRALKRLMNSLSLISCINNARNQDAETKVESKIDLLVNFALVSIQIAYPPVYRLLVQYAGFNKWNEKIAMQMNLKSLDQESVDKLNASEEFDEEWEKVLFRLCENDHFLKKNSLNISRLLNLLRNEISTNADSEIEDVIATIISLSSVTNLEAFDEPKVDYHKGNLLKKIQIELINRLRKSLPEKADVISKQGQRVQSNAYIKFQKQNWGDWIKIFTNPQDGGIKIYIVTSRWFAPVKHFENFEKALKQANLLEEYKAISEEYLMLIQNHNGYNGYDLNKEVSRDRGNFNVDIYAVKVYPNLSSFDKPEVLDEINEVVLDLYKVILKINTLSDKANAILSVN